MTVIEGIFGITFSSVWESFPRNVNYNYQANKLPSLKEERPWFKSVHSQVLQDTLKRLDKAYQNFYRRVREGKEKAGYPEYKKKGQWDSITYPQYSKKPEDNIIKVSKIGKVKIRYHREIPIIGTIKTLTIEEDGGKWFACFSVEMPKRMIELKQDLSRAVGLDAGLIDFYYASDGSHIEVPKYFRKAEKKLKRVQEKFSKLEAKYKGKKKPKKFYKLLKVLQKLHYHVRCQREDFLHKQANRLLAEFDIIIHEDLNIQGMKRRPKPEQDEDGKYLPNRASQKAGLNKSISDVARGKFFQILKYKAKRRGKTVIAVPPQYTSQICSGCNNMVKKSLSMRTHICPVCNLIIPRDYNSALYIKKLGLKKLKELVIPRGSASVANTEGDSGLSTPEVDNLLR